MEKRHSVYRVPQMFVGKESVKRNEYSLYNGIGNFADRVSDLFQRIKTV